MYLIKKSINNNVVLAEDDEGRELVAFGTGIGFCKVPSYLDDERRIQRRFYDVSPSVYDAIASLSPQIILASSNIVDIARQELACELNPNLIFTLADHLQYALERVRKGVIIENPLAEQVAYIYPREMEVGRRGVKAVRGQTDEPFPDVEAASIALHLVNAEPGEALGARGNMGLVVKSAELLEDVTRIIEHCLALKLDRSSYSYVRFVTHVRYLIGRLMSGTPEQSPNGSLFSQVAHDFPDVYDAACRVAEFFLSTQGWRCSDEEMLYLMMHVNRLEATSRDHGSAANG